MVANVIYSASIEEREIVDCFFEDHDTGLDPRKTMNPVVEQRLVGSPAQSALAKADKVKGPGEK